MTPFEVSENQCYIVTVSICITDIYIASPCDPISPCQEISYNGVTNPMYQNLSLTPTTASCSAQSDLPQSASSLSRISAKNQLVEPMMYQGQYFGGSGSLERRNITQLRGLLKSPMRRSASCIGVNSQSTQITTFKSSTLSRKHSSTQSISNHDSWYGDKERDIRVTKDRNGQGTFC